MEAGGSSAEYGRYIGSSTNVIVKSGTNKFHSDILWQRQEVSWGADYIDQPSLEARQSTPYPQDWFKRCRGDERDAGRSQITIGSGRIAYQTDGCIPGSDEEEGGSDGYEFSAGGPLARDKAWFFIGWSDFDDAFNERLLGGDPYDVSLKNEARIFKFNVQPRAGALDRRVVHRHPGVPQLLQSGLVRLLDADAARERLRADHGQLELVDLEQLLPRGQDRRAGDPGEQVPGLQQHRRPDLYRPEGTGPRPGRGALGSRRLGAEQPAAALPEQPGSGSVLARQQLQRLRRPREPELVAQRLDPLGRLRLQRLPARSGQPGPDPVRRRQPRDQVRHRLPGHEVGGQQLPHQLHVRVRLRLVQRVRLPRRRYGARRHLLAAARDRHVSGQPGPVRPHDPAGRGCVWVDYNTPLLLEENGGPGRGTGDAEMQDTGFYMRDRFTVGDH